MACNLFRQAGYRGASMRSLAASVGISAGSLYYHIDSKQALLSDLISEYELNLLQVFRSKTVGMAKHPLQMVTLLWEL
jgi:AcrR family transcriptional regulator